MSNMGEVAIQSFENPEEIFSFISQRLITRDHKLGFRGHACSSWELETTLTRFSKQILSKFPDEKHNLETITSVTKNRLERQFINNLIVNNDLPRDKAESIDIWQFGQHFGLPSPLLDWSHSPYIALFFALSDGTKASVNSEKCIWAINIDLINEINDLIIREIWPEFIERIQPIQTLHELYLRDPLKFDHSISSFPV